MSTESKLCDEVQQHRKENEAALHTADSAVSCGTEKNTIQKYTLKEKYYKSLFHYCSEIAEELPQRQAFYAVDFEDILWKIQEWTKCLPNVEIFYAVKANTDPVLLKLLTLLGLSFDCASMGEIKMVLEAGAATKNIILAHTIKTVEELKFSSEKGVELMTFDNEDELLKIHHVYPSAKLLIRICPKIINCSYDLSKKFGCSEDDAVHLLKFAYKLDLNVIGISFHVGSLCTDPMSYVSTIEIARRLFDVAKNIGFTFSILDIGGGFFGASGTQHIFYKMAVSINTALEKYFSDIQVRIIAEPGIYVVQSAFHLVNTVLGRRCFDNVGKPRRHYFLNDSIYGSFNSYIYLCGCEPPTPLMTESEIQSRPKYESRLYGQTCSSSDVIMDNVVLPDLKIGERVMWSDKGAYSHGVSSTFCGIPIPVPRYAFVYKQRLNLDLTIDKATVGNFLKQYVCFIGCTEETI